MDLTKSEWFPVSIVFPGSCLAIVTAGEGSRVLTRMRDCSLR